MSYEFVDYPDRDMLAIDLANQIAGDLRSILTHEDRVVLAVPGGTSPGPVFDDLCAADLDWSRVDVILTDERWVPEDSPRSNTALIKARLLQNRAAQARLLPLFTPGAECDQAVKELAAAIEGELPLGVVLLGMGTDMHTASLFPGADRLAEGLSKDAPLLLPMRAPGAPEPRVTLTAPVLNGALRKHVLIFGEDKKAALQAAKGKSPSDAPINAVLDGAKVHWGGINRTDETGGVKTMWDNIIAHAGGIKDRRIEDLFADPSRAENFSVEALGMLFDYSKTQIDAPILESLIGLLDAANVPERRDAMFAGAKINETEGRAVLHTALRNLDGGPVEVDGVDVMPGVLDTLERMEDCAKELRASDVTDVVNIGIGGSDLGPAMAVRALAPYHDGPRCHFVSNVDGADIADTLRLCDPKRTVFIVASKTFTTIETMTNARTAKAWLADKGVSLDGRFIALSSNEEKAAEFGIPASRVFGFEDWVGGRYSMWGPIGLSLMIAIGGDAFRAFLRGGQAMDMHFRAAAPEENLPMLLALVGIWHNQGLGHATRAVLPYDNRLARLAAYFQQLEMESNGKGVSMDGANLPLQSGPVVWGEPGTNGQHAFYQLIHQGTRVIPCEFMVAAEGHEPDLAHHHHLLVANCLAQSEALMRGRSLDEARGKVAGKFEGAELERQARHRVFPGNRPSTTLIYPKLDPETLGKIVALYEHRVFVEGVILDINSYDQWGVELGKELATALGPLVTGDAPVADKDGSTAQLLGFVHRHSA